MATKITDRAVIVARGTIAANNCAYIVWADAQVGQRVQMNYPNRYWLALTLADGRKVVQSTQREAVYADWMNLITENGAAA